ncbi:MAG: 23S rRNA (adenine(2503)-C(2))-methyltransferase RlmN [Alphaproteobacteria bacterium]|nr:23S rRNA (adenine(2503)-C(2))-methyltransferase RlmN [Alphaproteobacteria bacterium]
MGSPKSLIGLTREGLKAAFADAGVEPKHLSMRAGQIWNAAYVQGATGFDAITTLAKPLRAEFAERFTLARPEVVTAQMSQDGTRKWLIRFGPGVEVETVFIPDEDRGTLCISSQVGCTLTCRFCHTGTQKLVRNLTAEEIVSQVLVARDDLKEWPRAGRNSDERQITNVVMMGMGEPLYNFENVRDAINVIADGEGLSVSKRRITLSTAGVAPMIERAGEEIGAMLAISLHAPRDDVRDVIVPLNKKYPIKELLAACRAYPGLSNARRITFEYVMLKGVNDSNADARELVKIIGGIPAKINLIPFNAWPGAPYECSDWERIEEFGEIVNRAGYASPIRTPRGRDIMAACGQLKSESVKARASDRIAELRSKEIVRMPH